MGHAAGGANSNKLLHVPFVIVHVAVGPTRHESRRARLHRPRIRPQEHLTHSHSHVTVTLTVSLHTSAASNTSAHLALGLAARGCPHARRHAGWISHAAKARAAGMCSTEPSTSTIHACVAPPRAAACPRQRERMRSCATRTRRVKTRRRALSRRTHLSLESLPSSASI